MISGKCVATHPARHHEHTFAEQNGGALAKDRGDYAVPGGPLLHRLFVRRDLERICAYRRQRLEELLGATAGISCPRAVAGVKPIDAGTLRLPVKS